MVSRSISTEVRRIIFSNMEARAKATIAKPSMTIRHVMEVIQNQTRAKPPGPAGIALITDNQNKLLYENHESPCSCL